MIKFIKSTLEEINPWENIKILHTNIKNDIVAGITVGIIALPLALAFGEISQLGPIAGIWGAIAGGLVGGLFGGCMVGVSGPTAPKAAQIAAFMGAFVIGTTNEPDLVAAFSIIFLSGLILIAIAFLKISRFVHYIPYPVVAGFMCGIGAIVILTQINAFVGLSSEKNIHDVVKNFQSTIQNINVEALYVAIPSLLILFSWKSIEKKYNFLSNIPSPLVSLIMGTSIACLMNLNIPYIGDKMGNSSSTNLTLYLPDLVRLGEFIFPAFALAILAILDSLLSCVVADNITGTRHSSDRETFGQGMANMAAGLVGGVTTATATMRTVANIKFGAKTPLSSIVHGLTLLSILLGLGFLVESIPTACLAAILFKVGIDILDYRILRVIRKLPVTDLVVFIIVLFMTIYADLMIAVAIGTIVAILFSIKYIYVNYSYKIISILESDFLNKQSRKKISKFPISIFEIKSPLFFGSIESLMKFYSQSGKHEVLIIDISTINMIDLSGAYGLEDFIKGLESKNIKVYIFIANSKIRKILENLDFINHISKSECSDSKNYIYANILKHYQIK
ncbi:SulP family inorganic anion transporter [Candidatus Marinimicrobia bacterium]|nr:SulP family inorganic anion transporter [Candidatus Neomarinimicrobiota bacterium]